MPAVEGTAPRDPFVVLLRWPEEAATLAEVRAAGTPRLLVVAPEAPAPLGLECDEDWIRLPASDDDLRVRMATVAARASRHATAPVVEGDGRIRFRGRWAPLSETEEAFARTLAERFGEVVGQATLASCVRPALTPTSVRVQVMRLRARIDPLGLVVRTVRNHGYVLEPAHAGGAAGAAALAGGVSGARG